MQRRELIGAVAALPFIQLLPGGERRRSQIETIIEVPFNIREPFSSTDFTTPRFNPNKTLLVVSYIRKPEKVPVVFRKHDNGLGISCSCGPHTSNEPMVGVARLFVYTEGSAIRITQG